MSQLTKRVTLALDALLKSAEAFTLLDLSNRVKQDGGDFVEHSDIREVAKAILDTLIVGRGYTLTPITVTNHRGDKVTANLYHPWQVDAASYTARSQVASAPCSNQARSCTGVGGNAAKTAPVATKSAVATLPAPTHVLNARATKRCKVRADGALEIPVAILDEAGLVGQTDIVNHPNSLSIVDGTQRGRAPGGYRISAAALANSNLAGKREVTVCAFSDKVVVSA